MRGFSLIEILISLFILSLFLLGFEKTELLILRENEQAYLFSVAANQLNNMAQQLQHSLKIEDLSFQVGRWNEKNKKVLPFAKGYVNGQFPHLRVEIFWGASTDLNHCEKMIKGKLNCMFMEVDL